MQSDKSPEASANEEYNKGAPRRIIDVGESEKDLAYVVDVQKAFPQGNISRYCTLSYCWGDPSLVMQMTSKNREELMDKKRGLGNLEGQQTYQQAIAITRRLAVRYIWIDALCIVQQGPDGDFHVEATKMHSIYRNSYCTISAAGSRDARGGLYSSEAGAFPGSTVETAPTLVTVGKNPKGLTPGTWLIAEPGLWEEQLLHASPLYSRGWVFQGKPERISETI